MIEGPDMSAPSGNLARLTGSDGTQAFQIEDDDGDALAVCIFTRDQAIKLAEDILRSTRAVT